MVKGIGLISGGLDSILAVKVLQDQGIQTIGVTFVTPFFGSKKAERVATLLNISHRVIDISYPHLKMVQSPKHGYGKGLNPCIDCHALMFREAGKIMIEEGADFLFSGEVLGERPMSQNYKSLISVAKESGYSDLILRPLSAKLLLETLPEREGKVSREKLLDIQGRSRKRQIELADYYGITEYSQPAGGCLLTEPGYSRKLIDLIKNNPEKDIRDVRLLEIGRHFRIGPESKIIVGRDQAENEKIMSMKNERDIIIDVRDYPGPIVIIPNCLPDDFRKNQAFLVENSANNLNPLEKLEKIIVKAASICAAYSDAPEGGKIPVDYYINGNSHTIMVGAFPKDELAKIRI